MLKLLCKFPEKDNQKSDYEGGHNVIFDSPISLGVFETRSPAWHYQSKLIFPKQNLALDTTHRTPEGFLKWQHFLTDWSTGLSVYQVQMCPFPSCPLYPEKWNVFRNVWVTAPIRSKTCMNRLKGHISNQNKLMSLGSCLMEERQKGNKHIGFSVS